MIRFTATIEQFAENGEKTGWSYIAIPTALAEKINPGVRKSYRVKGRLDEYAIQGVALVPMGQGDFIMAINATMRKALRKHRGAKLRVEIVVDEKPLTMSAAFVECLADEPKAMTHFKSLPKSHQLYFSRWIDSAKTEPTRAKRIARAVNALARGWGFSEMMRAKEDH